MNVKYNIIVNTVNAGLKVYAHCLPKTVKHKFPEFVKGRMGLIGRIYKAMKSAPADRPVAWFHASSLGEYAIARPLIARIKADGNATVVVTFFSPSGYRVLKDNHPGVDYVFYLPLDTRKNVRGFLDAVKPAVAVFLVSEYWPNMLQQLKFNAVPTYLVSAIIRNDSPFFKWYGKIYRKALLTYKRFFVLDENSMLNLEALGCDNVTLSGDPLFDNAALIARTPWTDAVLEKMAAHGPLFMAGSVSDSNDLNMVAAAINERPGLRAVIVPHDVSRKSVEAIRRALNCKSAVYSECDESTDLGDTRVLVIDCVGKLAYMYRYASYAYVGGGFTSLLHSVIEATVYGLPVSFGPRIERKVTPKQLIELGIGQMVTDSAELGRWIDSMTPGKLEETRRIAARYVDRNLGATEEIVKTIEHSLWRKN